MVHYLLEIREEIEKLASGDISHREAFRLEKIPISPLFLRKYFVPEVNRGQTL
jgi:hypothetical protein